jgi:hypothetical protein
LWQNGYLSNYDSGMGQVLERHVLKRTSQHD